MLPTEVSLPSLGFGSQKAESKAEISEDALVVDVVDFFVFGWSSLGLQTVVVDLHPFVMTS